MLNKHRAHHALIRATNTITHYDVTHKNQIILKSQTTNRLHKCGSFLEHGISCFNIILKHIVMENRRTSKFGNHTEEEEEDPNADEIPSHRCLIVDRSFEALKSARSSTVAMHKYNKDITDHVHSEVHKGLEYEGEVHDGKTFLHKAENDSVLAIIREREEEGFEGGECSERDFENTKDNTLSSTETASNLNTIAEQENSFDNGDNVENLEASTAKDVITSRTETAENLNASEPEKK